MDRRIKKLQYVSDIHLEFRTLQSIPIIQPIEPGNTYLALCGDIGNPYLSNYQEFLDIHSKLYEHILLISGNHEYYNILNNQNSIDQVDNHIREIVKKYNNVTYLNRNKIIIGRTKFIGCTLWTDVTRIKMRAETSMNDYKHIYVDSNNSTYRIKKNIHEESLTIKSREQIIQPFKEVLRADDVINMNRKMREWLEHQINKFGNADCKKYDDIIILTHHAPTTKMLPIRDVYSDCYASNCEDIIKFPVKYWISGHTHACMKCEINGATCLSNCMGYPGQNVTNYDNKYIEFY